MACNGTTYLMGDLTVQACCPPNRVMGNLAFTLACGAEITNTGQSTVQGNYSPVGPNGTQRGATTSFALEPGQRMTFPMPPTNTAWLVADMTRAQAEGIAWTAILLAAAVGGLAAVGAYDIVKGIVVRHRRKQQRQRFNRFFE